MCFHAGRSPSREKPALTLRLGELPFLFVKISCACLPFTQHTARPLSYFCLPPSPRLWTLREPSHILPAPPAESTEPGAEMLRADPSGVTAPRGTHLHQTTQTPRPPQHQEALWPLRQGFWGSLSCRNCSPPSHLHDGLRGGAAARSCRLRGSQAPRAAEEGPRRDPLHKPPHRCAQTQRRLGNGTGKGTRRVCTSLSTYSLTSLC